MHYETLFLKALAATVITETLVLMALCMRFGPKPIPWARILVAGILASSGTLPYLWYILPSFISTRSLLILIGEISVTLVEIPVLRYIVPLSWTKAALFSAICNLASIGVGLLIF